MRGKTKEAQELTGAGVRALGGDYGRGQERARSARRIRLIRSASSNLSQRGINNGARYARAFMPLVQLVRAARGVEGWRKSRRLGEGRGRRGERESKRESGEV